MPLFCSNYKPATDHLLSRSLICEYKKSIRGPEKHVKWLMQNKELLQRLMLSYMQNYNLFDRKLFVWDLDRNRTQLRDSVKKELADNDWNAVLQDRQVTQFASLVTVYHWIFPKYREKIGEIRSALEELEDDLRFQETGNDRIQEMIKKATDQKLLSYVRSEIIRTAVVAAQYDPLTDYIETLGALVQANEITEKHFNWTKDGTLKVYATAVWGIYESEKRGTDGMVRKDLVDNKLREMSELSKDGDLKTVNWTISESSTGLKTTKVRKRGYYIKDAVDNELFRNAFNWEKYRPEGAELPEAYTDKYDEDSAPF